MNIFFANISGKEATMSEEESWHCVKVLRKKAGDPVTVIDGKGQRGEGIIAMAHPKQCTITLHETRFFEPNRNYRLHIAIAPTKNIDRIEWFVEKAVEIGIDEISFVQCKNSERTVIKTDRIHKIAESAVKQSLQYYMPEVNDMIPYGQFMEHAGADLCFIAHCEEDQKRDFKTCPQAGKSHLVLIGPEGDFTPVEIEQALKKNFVPVSLGENRLRTETAGLYVCNTLAVVL
ncbi:MAG: 16S rRNA (uracil(1498)-N(3))-methyltransferase [Bacteroidetes bacterium]|nr:16S rRNA (uracil(1498)-N(3))-methyltransferase [Bacteroidota bacterium]